MVNFLKEHGLQILCVVFVFVSLLMFPGLCEWSFENDWSIERSVKRFFGTGEAHALDGTDLLGGGISTDGASDGEVYTYNASTGEPEWQAASGGGVDHDTTYTLLCEFDGIIVGQFTEDDTGEGSKAFQNVSGGVCRFTTDTTADDVEQVDGGTVYWLDSAESPTMTVRLALGDVTDPGTVVRFGFQGSSTADYAYVEFDDGTTADYWVVKSSQDGGSSTNENSDVTPVVDTMEIIDITMTTSSVTLTIDGTLEATISTAGAIPIAAVQPFIWVSNGDASAEYADIDFIYITASRP